MKWRHMTYNPLADFPIDFTWEREWRIKTDKLHINRTDCSVIMPDLNWARQLKSLYERSQDWEIDQYKKILGDIAELYRENFPWRIYLLKAD